MTGHPIRHPWSHGWRWWLRQILGWFFIVLGVAGIFLPLLPGVLFLPIGVALVGRRSLPMRWLRTRVKRGLRHAEKWPGWLGSAGRFFREKEQRLARFLNDRRRKKAASPPPDA